MKEYTDKARDMQINRGQKPRISILMQSAPTNSFIIETDRIFRNPRLERYCSSLPSYPTAPLPIPDKTTHDLYKSNSQVREINNLYSKNKWVAYRRLMGCLQAAHWPSAYSPLVAYRQPTYL